MKVEKLILGPLLPCLAKSYCQSGLVTVRKRGCSLEAEMILSTCPHVSLPLPQSQKAKPHKNKTEIGLQTYFCQWCYLDDKCAHRRNVALLELQAMKSEQFGGGKKLMHILKAATDPSSSRRKPKKPGLPIKIWHQVMGSKRYFSAQCYMMLCFDKY